VRLKAGLLTIRFGELSGGVVERDGSGGTCFFLNLGRGESSDSAMVTFQCKLIDVLLFDQQLAQYGVTGLIGKQLPQL
jgi:hypothetical protein